jgi:hypothetical protein
LTQQLKNNKIDFSAIIQSFSQSKENGSQVWWPMAAIPALGRLRHEDHKFQSSMGYMVRDSI